MNFKIINDKFNALNLKELLNEKKYIINKEKIFNWNNKTSEKLNKLKEKRRELIKNNKRIEKSFNIVYNKTKIEKNNINLIKKNTTNYKNDTFYNVNQTDKKAYENLKKLFKVKKLKTQKSKNQLTRVLKSKLFKDSYVRYFKDLDKPNLIQYKNFDINLYDNDPITLREINKYNIINNYINNYFYNNFDESFFTISYLPSIIKNFTKRNKKEILFYDFNNNLLYKYLLYNNSTNFFIIDNNHKFIIENFHEIINVIKKNNKIILCVLIEYYNNTFKINLCRFVNVTTPYTFKLDDILRELRNIIINYNIIKSEIEIEINSKNLLKIKTDNIVKNENLNIFKIKKNIKQKKYFWKSLLKN